MYKLYWCPETASSVVMAALEEAGAAYELHLVDTREKQHKTPEYLAINPCGLVPALALPDGRTIFESAAMIMEICDRHPKARLAPPPGDPDRPVFYQWMLYMADTLYPDYRRYFYADRYSTDPADAPRIRAKAMEDLLTDWKVIDDALAGREWLVGGRLGGADLYMETMVTWFDPMEALFARYGNIARVAGAVAARPAVIKAAARHRR